MKKGGFGKAVVKSRYVILALSLFLLFPSLLGYMKTRINYDMLTYLPKDIETMKGQDIMEDQFGKGGFSMIICEGMPFKDVSKMKAEMEKVPHVDSILWYDDFADISIPVELLPDKIRKAFYNADKDSTLMFAVLDTTVSSDEAIEAVSELRKIASKQTFISGMSAVAIDTKELADKEAPIYVVMAVILCMIVLSLTMDSFLAPVFFILSIGIAVVYNAGTNIIFGRISYLTQALAAVLQLGVTLDYSIFLWHSYEEQKAKRRTEDMKRGDLPKEQKHEAMAEAVNATLDSIVGSSATTIAGFVALCFMSYKIGQDIGLVMAKGVFLGMIVVVTVLPSMILIFDRAIEKTHHKVLLPKFKRIPAFVQKYYPLMLVIFGLVWIPAIKGYFNTDVYYNLDRTLPDTLPSIVASQKLEDEFNMNTEQMILVPSDMEPKVVEKMCDEIRNVDGIKAVLGLDALLGAEYPRELISDEIKDVFVQGDWQMVIMTSEYKVASDEVNAQCDAIQKIIKGYDPRCMLVGEAACTKDLIEITNHDFAVVNWISIAVVGVVLLFVFRSISIPVLLVFVIEFAIFINLGIPHYTHTVLPFIASIVISTIQLGSTVDYAVLMTSRYKTERIAGKSRKDAVYIAHQTSISSVLVSAFSFFGATFGVGMYSQIDMISSLCMLMARGALISMVTVVFILPAVLYAFDRVIIYTTVGFKEVRRAHKAAKKQQKLSGDTAEA